MEGKRQLRRCPACLLGPTCQRRRVGPALSTAHNQRHVRDLCASLSPPNGARATSSASCSPSRTAAQGQTQCGARSPRSGPPGAAARLGPALAGLPTLTANGDRLSHTRSPTGVRSSHRRRLGRVSERGCGRKADSAPMKGALLRRRKRKRPVRGAGRQAGRGGPRQVRALRLVDRWEVWRGRGGRREERLCGSLVVRHEILGVGPKHRFILENPSENTHKRGDGKKKTDKRERLDYSAEPDRLVTAILRRPQTRPNVPRVLWPRPVPSLPPSILSERPGDWPGCPQGLHGRTPRGQQACSVRAVRTSAVTLPTYASCPSGAWWLSSTRSQSHTDSF